MNKWLIIGIIAVVLIVVIIVIIVVMKKDDETDNKTKSNNQTTQNFTVSDEIVVPVTSPAIETIPVHVDTNNDQYGNPTVNAVETDAGSIQQLQETYPFRSQINFDTYPSNPDLYPENGVEFRPENNMYTHLENNFLDIGPQIGVGTRVNSHRNAPRLNFRKDFAVPTMPTGYWNQSTISQPIMTHDVC